MELIPQIKVSLSGAAISDLIEAQGANWNANPVILKLIQKWATQEPFSFEQTNTCILPHIYWSINSQFICRSDLH